MLRRLTMGCLLAGVTFISVPTLAGAGEREGDVSSAEAVSPILVGTAVPDGPLRAQDGQETTLRKLLGGSPTVLVFYRGHW
jgi:cytochrome oxidase Cu insertion factor (SCO1/SenC/PrrC family)